jgi:hypothetical protein
MPGFFPAERDRSARDPRGARGTRGTRAFALTGALLGSITCALGACWSFDFDEPPPGSDASDSSARADSGTSIEAGDAKSDAFVKCVSGGYYCGGEQVPGDTRSLYRCNPDGSVTRFYKCATACVVSAPGKDDACSPATSCKVNGTYCGGDKVNGDPDVLYKCLTGGGVSVVQRCTKGCQVNPNDDDACK